MFRSYASQCTGEAEVGGWRLEVRAEGTRCRRHKWGKHKKQIPDGFFGRYRSFRMTDMCLFLSHNCSLSIVHCSLSLSVRHVPYLVWGAARNDCNRRINVLNEIMVFPVTDVFIVLFSSLYTSHITLHGNLTCVPKSNIIAHGYAFISNSHL